LKSVLICLFQDFFSEESSSSKSSLTWRWENRSNTGITSLVYSYFRDYSQVSHILHQSDCKITLILFMKVAYSHGPSDVSFRTSESHLLRSNKVKMTYNINIHIHFLFYQENQCLYPTIFSTINNPTDQKILFVKTRAWFVSNYMKIEYWSWLMIPFVKYKFITLAILFIKVSSTKISGKSDIKHLSINWSAKAFQVEIARQNKKLMTIKLSSIYHNLQLKYATKISFWPSTFDRLLKQRNENERI
jgi:hypothetical protein